MEFGSIRATKIPGGREQQSTPTHILFRGKVVGFTSIPIRACCMTEAFYRHRTDSFALFPYCLIVHYHSNDPRTGRRFEAAKMLSAELNEQNLDSELRFDQELEENKPFPSLMGSGSGSAVRPRVFLGKGISTFFFHGMLDPWFKRKYPLKHIKNKSIGG